MEKRLTRERRNEIAQKLITDGKISASLLSKEYGVSVETIRKDLIWLETKGIAKKSYGGAIVSTELMEQNFLEKAIKNQQEKEQIAKKAAELVHDGDIVILDSGSTVFAIAKQLTLGKKNLTVFTNSLKAAQCLADANIKTYMLGGEVRTTSYASTGSWAVRNLSEIRANIAFLGTSGFQRRGGPCIENFNESEVKNAIIRAANQVVVVADGSKAHCDAMVQFAQWEEIDTLITDEKADPQVLAVLEKKTKIILA